MDKNLKNKCWMCVRFANFMVFWISCCGADHVTSSTYKLTSLIEREQMLLDHLSQISSIASAQPALKESHKNIAELNKTIEFMRRRHAPLEQHPEILQHPVAAFRLIQRLASDWDRVTRVTRKAKSQNEMGFIENNLQTMRDIISKWRIWPTPSSSEDAALGVIRIGHVYSLYPNPMKTLPTVFSSKNYKCSCPAGKRFLSISEKYGRCSKVESGKYNAFTGYKFERSGYALDNQTCFKSLISRFKNTGPNYVMTYSSPLLLAENSRRAYELTKGIGLEKIRSKSQEWVESYSYNTISTKDLRFLAKVAWQNKYCTEAKVWDELARLSASHEVNSEESESIHCIRTSEGHQNVPLHNPFHKECVEERGFNSYAERIHRQYIKLCQESAEGVLPSLHMKKTCTWHYVWPYVRLNEEAISLNPQISRFYDVISPRDIEHVKKMAQSQLSDSALSSTVRANIQDVRVSQTAWLPNKSLTLQKLSRLAGEATGLDTGFSDVGTPAEAFQVVNYGLGGLYAPHEDSVRTSRNIGVETTEHLRNAGDRMATWMFYLSDVELGGATVFPVLNISVAPIKGSAVLWYNLLRNGEPDTRMIHAGCPVAIGDKWVANKWIRERSQVFRRPCSLFPHQ